MSNSLPTKIKVGIRDSWEAKDCLAQTAIASLKAILGADVTIKPQWQVLWAELQSQYPEMAVFVPSVGEAVAAWCKTTQALLEDEEGNAKWVEDMLEECLYGPSGLRVRVEVCLRPPLFQCLTYPLTPLRSGREDCRLPSGWQTRRRSRCGFRVLASRR